MFWTCFQMKRNPAQCLWYVHLRTNLSTARHSSPIPPVDWGRRKLGKRLGLLAQNLQRGVLHITQYVN
jgi:hypothetical protein